jgi:hypothetical protein
MVNGLPRHDIQLLGVDRRAKGGKQTNARLVKLLLEKGAEPNAQGGYYRCPFQLAT